MMNAFEAVADQVVLKGITFEAEVGLDLWHRPGKTQPIALEVHLTPPGGLEAAAQEDNVAYTIDYGKLYKALKGSVFNGKFSGLSQLYQAIKASFPETVSWSMNITLPKGILEANGGLTVTWTGQVEAGGLPSITQMVTIRDIECRCIIGVNDNERLEKQRLIITLVIVGMENRLSPALIAGVSIDPSPSLAYQLAAKEVVERVEGSAYQTIESLAAAIAQTVTMGHGFENVRVTIDKSGGVAGRGCSGVVMSRSRSYFENKDFWKVKRP